MEKMALKHEILIMFDNFADEHPKGHQDSKMARYHVGNHANGPLTIAFEKNENSGVNIWCPIKVDEYVDNVNREFKLAASLWTTLNKKGEKEYGRHTGLKSLPELSEVDLVKFTPKTLGEAERVIEGIKKAAADGII